MLLWEVMSSQGATKALLRLTRAGRQVDVLARSDDADSILEGAESQYPWVEITAPVPLVAQAINHTPKAIRALWAQDRADQRRVPEWNAKERWGAVRRYLSTDPTSHTSPLLMLYSPETKRLRLLDGYHRLSVSMLARQKTLTILVGFGEPED